MTADAHISGINTLLSDIPAAFIASSSLFSPNVPNVIIEASSVASGSDNGIRVMLPQPRNSSMTFMLRPLPTSSSIYSHRNCIIRMKMTTSRIAMNGPMNDFSMNWSSFFIPWSELKASASLSSSFTPHSREAAAAFIPRRPCICGANYLVASSTSLSRASARPAAFLPPAVAKPGWPPPPPWISFAASLTSVPALRPFLTRSSEYMSIS